MISFMCYNTFVLGGLMENISIREEYESSMAILREFEESFYSLGKKFQTIYISGRATRSQMEDVENFWKDESGFTAFIESKQVLTPIFEEAVKNGELSQEEFNLWDKTLKSANLSLASCRVCAMITSEDVVITERKDTINLAGLNFEIREYIPQAYARFKATPSTQKEDEDDGAENF